MHLIETLLTVTQMAVSVLFIGFVMMLVVVLASMIGEDDV